MSGSTKKAASKNAWRRAKAKKEKAEAVTSRDVSEQPATETSTEPQSKPEPENRVDNETQPATDGDATTDGAVAIMGDDISADDPLFDQFKGILERFQQSQGGDNDNQVTQKPEVYFDDDEVPEEEDDQPKPLSKKKKKEMNKLSVAELKALVRKPDLVEWTDVSSPDPRLLVAIKSHRNVVPVPTHWSLKREYLSSKRGIEKPPFALPKFIQETGIAEMRDAVLEKQDQQSLKQKQRERVQGKINKLDIDYQKLYEAFFRFQTKPELTRYGEVYYEGKEYETNLRHLRPGELSEELKEALSIPPGAPPPWLINMQRFGPPPSYPALKIPGLNAPPPPGAQWGFHPGGYGKPPVDEYNRPLYGGDVFGVLQPTQPDPVGEPVEKTLWGELQEPEEESEEEEESDEEEEEDEEEEIGSMDTSGLITPGGIASTAPSEFGGAESVGDFTLRKQRRGTETEEPMQPRSAYTVVPERDIKASGFFGGEKAYDLKSAQQSLPVLGQEDTSRKKRKAGDVDVSVDVDSLEREDKLSKDEVKRQYEMQRQAEQQGGWGAYQDDLSSMIAEESAKRLKKDQERRGRR
ncbi:PSP proline-rich [Macrophomina phaseolina MS6]|uniref:PSP proline-rich n=1 Tax=Macrophomina phaseolina (strain MS6) TaxID=1126212 RepID=K2R9V5_MACPH|nr:PSP proline-rich [Macrophomina phaseolina MS6]